MLSVKAKAKETLKERQYKRSGSDFNERPNTNHATCEFSEVIGLLG
jgi:hypothetical protein